ncbi:MAG: PEGA domain-containing protein, partial [Acidobacteriota bacterium]
QLPLRSTKSQQPKVQQQVDVERANRRLLSPLGSAANVRRGWYRQNLSQPVHQGPVQGPVHGHGGFGGYGGYGVPYVVYVNPAPSEPRVVDETPPPAYEPPPIFIVQPDQVPDYATPVRARPYPSPSAPTLEPSVPQDVAPREPRQPRQPERPRSTDPQPVTIRVNPADAQVYVDGELMGAAADLASLDLRPGVYVVEVEHPEFGSQRLVFGVDDEPLSVAVDLLADRPSRRSRVK